ncbi:MAG: hypothetical protein ABMA25_01620 [Ilumatobacteraceae bacterium]
MKHEDRYVARVNRRTDAVGPIGELLNALTMAGWTVGLGGVTVDATGSVVFSVSRGPELLAAFIQEFGLPLPHKIELTDRFGVIYPPVDEP